MVEALPDQTLAELQERLAKAGITTSVTSLDRFLRFLGLTYKKTS
jgi:transposase